MEKKSVSGGSPESILDERYSEIKSQSIELLGNLRELGYELDTVEEVLSIEMPDTQKEYNILDQIKQNASKLNEDLEECLFLQKTNTEVLDFLDAEVSQERLTKAAQKVFLLRSCEQDADADLLEGQIRELCKSRSIKAQTLNKLFKQEKKGSQKPLPSDSYDVLGYDESRRTWLKVNGHIEKIPATSLKKEVGVIFGPDVSLDEIIDNINLLTSRKGRISIKRALGQGIHLLDDCWVIISGEKALQIDKNTLEKTEIKDIVFGKYLLDLEGEAWIDLQKIDPNQSSLLDFNDAFLVLKNLIKEWSWSKGSSVHKYVSAFLVLTIFQQAMKWRPILYLSGAQGTGKTMFADLFKNLFWNLPEVLDKTTAPAIRQTFGDNSKPGFLDEFEHYESEKRQKDILNLLKSACYGGKVNFGTISKHAKECYLAHQFWLASISFPKCIETDAAIRDRLVVFDLEKTEGKFLMLPSEESLKNLGLRLINGLLLCWKDLEKIVSHNLSEEVIKRAFVEEGHEARTVQNFAWSSALLEFCGDMKDQPVVPNWRRKKKTSDSDRIIEEIVQTKIKHSRGESLVSDLIYQFIDYELNSVANTSDQETRNQIEEHQESARNILNLNYLGVSKIGDSQEPHLCIQSGRLHTFFDKKEMFSGINPKTILSRVKGIKLQKAKFGGNALHSIVIPMSEVDRILGRAA